MRGGPGGGGPTGPDSLDVLRFATGLAEATGVEIPERDYPRIVTIDGCTAYLAAAARVA
ncbi:MAG TPA: hypothetical protein VLW53_00810 [Candidatus Eisenbacteria bacterium]|nr:hypothetical protein [Candidatus Eisenbacteria bacterium]